MIFGRAFGYAMRALAYLVQHVGKGPVASHDIARVQRMPERFLLKVLKPLVSHGILTSVKGPHGGYQLARPAKSISVLEVYEATNGPIREEPPIDQYGKDDAFLAISVAVAGDLKKR